MLAITTAELNICRNEYLNIMRDSAMIDRKEKVDDGSGQQRDQITRIGPIPCRVVDLRVNRPIELMQQGQISAIMVLEIVFPHGTDVHVDDVIEVTSVDTGIVTKYEVVDNNDVRTDSLLSLVNVIKVN